MNFLWVDFAVACFTTTDIRLAECFECLEHLESGWAFSGFGATLLALVANP